MSTIPELLEQGSKLLRGNQFAEARQIYQRVLVLDPIHAEALNLLGLVEWQTGHFAESIEHLYKAIELDGSQSVFFVNLAEAYRGLGRLDKAIENYERAVLLDPSAALLHVHLASLLEQTGQVERAVDGYESALKHEPECFDALALLGRIRKHQGRLSAAEECYRRAAKARPGSAEMPYQIGNLRAIEGRMDDAIDWYERALQVQPGYDQAICSRGTARLALGRFAEGWADYEHRVECPQYNTLRLSQPLWDGSPLDGRRLLVHCEQGFGDTLQFIRYLPLVRSRGESVTVAAQAPLMPLLELSGFGPLANKKRPLPPFDVHAPLMSLPHIFRTQVDSVPADVPYLSVEESRVDRLRGELEKYPGFKVGISWQGRTSHLFDYLRSIPLEQFAPLARLPGVRLFSLQLGPGREQLARWTPSGPITDLADRIGGFHDTAAIIRNLDLVITCDSAPAHLAGALGVPVWVALSFSSEWRWMLGRDDSPWYPTMRLFRQTAPGQWPDVFGRMADALREQL